MQASSAASDPGLLILISLAAGERHGYAMMQDIRDFCGASVGPGTLYGAIARLESAGLIAGVDSPDRRRPYRLTGEGARELSRRMEEYRSLIDIARARSAL